jgi:hypothetical protein
MTYPWEQPMHADGRPEWTPRQKQGPHPRPELIKDPVTGLYPGQKDHNDIPGFLKRVREA